MSEMKEAKRDLNDISQILKQLTNAHILIAGKEDKENDVIFLVSFDGSTSIVTDAIDYNRSSPGQNYIILENYSKASANSIQIFLI